MKKHLIAPGDSLNENDGKAKKKTFKIDGGEVAAFEGNKNPFPVGAFPLAVQQIIKATNESLAYPIDFIGASILYAASLAIGNTYRVEVKKSWQESAVLFIANVGSPGTNKSHPLSFALQPIFDKQAKNFTVYEKKKKEYDQTVKLSKEDRQQQGINESVKPFWEKYTVSDFTPEALNEVHRFNKRCTGVYADELAGWFKNFNRYHKGAEQEFWLSAWSNKQITIDRKTGDSIFIPLPFIPVGGNMQPGILIELAKDRTQNGFIDRILFAFPDELKKTYWSKAEIDDAIICKWEKVITTLLNLELHLDDSLHPAPEVLKFSPEAFNKLSEWQRRNTDLCNQAESEALKGIYTKLENYTIRLALILEMLCWACESTTGPPIKNVGIEAVDGALQLVEYFRATAVKVHSIISNYNPLGTLPQNKVQFFLKLPNEFTTGQANEIGATYGLNQKFVQRFIGDTSFFTKVSQGNYCKIITA